MSERKKTAAELMAELQSDSGFRERQAEADRKRLRREQEYARILEPVLVCLRQHGLPGTSIQEIVRKFSPLPADAVEILLSALPGIADPRAKESIVRALCAADASFDGRPLQTCFEHTNDEGLKWAVLNTIALTWPHSIDDWLAAIRDTAAGETLRKIRASPKGTF